MGGGCYPEVGVTKILLLYEDPTIVQGSYYYTRILLLYKDPIHITAAGAVDREFCAI